MSSGVTKIINGIKLYAAENDWWRDESGRLFNIDYDGWLAYQSPNGSWTKIKPRPARADHIDINAGSFPSDDDQRFI